MATSSPPGHQPSPQQMAAMQQQIAMEAQKRGMTPQQFQQWQRQQIEADAKKAGLTFDQYVNRLKQQALEQHQRQQQIAQQQQAAQASGQPQAEGQGGEQVPITPGAADPRALAVAKWLRSQDLKPRTCILNGQRKDMFRGTSSQINIYDSSNISVTSQTRSSRPPIPGLSCCVCQESSAPTLLVSGSYF